MKRCSHLQRRAELSWLRRPSGFVRLFQHVVMAVQRDWGRTLQLSAAVPVLDLSMHTPCNLQPSRSPSFLIYLITSIWSKQWCCYILIFHINHDSVWNYFKENCLPFPSLRTSWNGRHPVCSSTGVCGVYCWRTRWRGRSKRPTTS